MTDRAASRISIYFIAVTALYIALTYVFTAFVKAP